MASRLTVRLGRPIQTVRPSGQGDAALVEEMHRRLQEARQESDRRIQDMRLDMDSDRRRLESARAALQDALDQTETLQTRIIAQSEEQVVELALEIARKVLQQEIQAGRYQIDPIVREALSRVPSRQGVRVHLNPDDYAACGLREDAPAEGGQGRVQFQPDPTVEAAHCLLETAQGFIDGGVDRQLAVVSAAMKGGAA
jgi:flagellar assembly protein FliH